MKKTFIALVVLAMLAGAAQAALTMVDDFESRPLGSIDQQGDWVAQANHSARRDTGHANVVVEDGDKALKLVNRDDYYHGGDVHYAFSALSLGAHSISGIGTIYLRYKADGTNDTILGTNSRNPGYDTDVYGDPGGSHGAPSYNQGHGSWASEGALTELSADEDFRARDDTIYTNVPMGQASGVWQELWIQVDCANTRSKYWLAATNGNEAVQIMNPNGGGEWWSWRNQNYTNDAVENLKFLVGINDGVEATIWLDTIAVDTSAHTTNRVVDSPLLVTFITNNVTEVGGTGTATPSGIVEVLIGGTTQIVYTAGAISEIVSFSTNSVSVPAAIGQTTYTQVFSNVTDPIGVDVTFGPTSFATYPAISGTPDGWMNATGVVNLAQGLLVGMTGPSVDSRNAVAVFELPTIGSGETVQTALFSAYLWQTTLAWGMGVDVYALRASSSTAFTSSNDFHTGTFPGVGVADGATGAIGIMDDFIVNDDGQPAISNVYAFSEGGSTALAAYLQTNVYAGGTGVPSEPYLLLRLSHDTEPGFDLYLARFTDTEGGSNIPTLTLVTDATSASSYTVSQTLTGNGTATPAGDVEVATGGTTQIVYAADDAWHEISTFTVNGVTDAAALGQTNYTKIFSNVVFDFNVVVEFSPLPAEYPATASAADGRFTNIDNGGTGDILDLVVGPADTNVAYNAVTVFALPTIGPGETVESALFTAYLHLNGLASGMGVDVYALRVGSSTAFTSNDYHMGAFPGVGVGDGSTGALGIMDDFVVSGDAHSNNYATGETADTALGAYLQTNVYAGGTGEPSEPYLLLRLSHDSEPAIPSYDFAKFAQVANPSDYPIPTLTLATSGTATPSYTVSQTLTGNGTATPAGDVEVASGGTTQIVYTADTWHEIDNFTVNSVVDGSALGETNYTKVFSNVSNHLNVAVDFGVTLASDGNTPATWYGPLGADPDQEDEDNDGLSLYVEFLLNTHPVVSNVLEITSHGLDGVDHPFVTWESLGLPNGALGTDYTLDLTGGSWTNLPGTNAHATGVTTWTGDDPVADPAAQYRLNLEYTP